MPKSRGTLAETRKLHNSHAAENRGDTEIRRQPNAAVASEPRPELCSLLYRHSIAGSLRQQPA